MEDLSNKDIIERFKCYLEELKTDDIINEYKESNNSDKKYIIMNLTSVENLLDILKIIFSSLNDKEKEEFLNIHIEILEIKNIEGVILNFKNVLIHNDIIKFIINNTFNKYIYLILSKEDYFKKPQEVFYIFKELVKVSDNKNILINEIVTILDKFRFMSQEIYITRDYTHFDYNDNVFVLNILDILLRFTINGFNKYNLDLDAIKIYALKDEFCFTDCGIFTQYFILTLKAFEISILNYKKRYDYILEDIKTYNSLVEKLDLIYARYKKEFTLSFDNLNNKKRLFLNAMQNKNLNIKIYNLFDYLFLSVMESYEKDSNIENISIFIKMFFDFSRKNYYENIFSNILEVSYHIMNNLKCCTNPYIICDCVNYIILFNTYKDHSEEEKINFIYQFTNFYVTIEKDMTKLYFSDKINYKRSVIEFLGLLTKSTTVCNCIEVSKITNFVFILFDDMNFVMDEYLSNLKKIHKVEKNELTLEEEERSLVENNTIICSGLYKIYLELILNISRNLSKVVQDHKISDKCANIVNYYLNILVGDKRKELILSKEKKQKYKFNPLEIVYKLLKIYINIIDYFDSEFFIDSIINDDRSFSISIFEEISKIIVKHHAFSSNDNLILNKLVKDINQKIENKQDEIDYPDEFCDPIYYSLITDPVVIPNTNNCIMDRKIIETHLMSCNENPFDRSKLTLEILNEFNSQEDIIEIINDFKKRFDLWKQANIK